MVPEDKRDAFYKAYTDTLSAGIVPPLTEKQGLAGPVVVDLDFKFSNDVKHLPSRACIFVTRPTW